MTLSRALMIHNNKLVDPQRHSRVAGSETFSAPDATEAGSRFVSSDAEEATVRHLGGPFISETVTLGSDDLALVIDPQRAVRDMAKELVFRYGTNDVADFVPAYDRFFDNLVADPCLGRSVSDPSGRSTASTGGKWRQRTCPWPSLASYSLGTPLRVHNSRC
mmetsp:Transcript_38146/g.59508  ORF Transcript_38146/g.59508 Transcript_38146/m.59508 type:complete len:162 (+) Transcript_38146:152-637(+)